MAVSSRQARGWAGINAFRRMLRKLPDALQEEVKGAVSDWAQAVQADAQSNAPKDTGDMAADCSISISRDGLAASVGYSPKLFPAQWRRSGWRAKFAEFGTKGYAAQPAMTNGKRKRKARRYVPARSAHPFLFPAVEMNRGWANEKMQKAVSNAIDAARQVGIGDE